MKIQSSVWKQADASGILLTQRIFYFTIGIILVWGFVLTHWISGMTAAWQPGIFTFLMVGLGLQIAGIIVSSVSGNWLVSLAGYHLVVAPFYRVPNKLRKKLNDDVQFADIVERGVCEIMPIADCIICRNPHYSSLSGSLRAYFPWGRGGKEIPRFENRVS